jgi:hypothetical protein
LAVDFILGGKFEVCRLFPIAVKNISAVTHSVIQSFVHLSKEYHETYSGTEWVVDILGDIEGSEQSDTSSMGKEPGKRICAAYRAWLSHFLEWDLNIVSLGRSFPNYRGVNGMRVLIPSSDVRCIIRKD